LEEAEEHRKLEEEETQEQLEKEMEEKDGI
jgi:hypothetical protein